MITARMRHQMFDVRCLMFDVASIGQPAITDPPQIGWRWAFSSSLRLKPLFPTSLEDEHVFQLRFAAKTMRDFTAGVAALRAAIDHDLFLRRPEHEKLREQFVPMIFVQQNCAGNVILLNRSEEHTSEFQSP